MFGGLPYMLIFLAVACATTGCSPSRVDYTGFTVRFYKYKYWGTAGWGPVFFTSGYQKKLETTIHRVTEINFQHSNITDYNIVHGQIYGYNTTISNFSAELSAYYKAPVSGVYTFRLAADNGASLQFGRGTSCCNDASGSVSGRFYINTLGPRGGGGSTDKNVNIASFHLQKGVYYPLKIVTFNWRGNSGLNLKVTDPQGNIIPDFGSHVFKAHFDESLCYTTITSLWRRSFRSTTTKTATPTNTVIVYVPRPKPRRAARYVPQIVEVTSSAPSVVETSSYRYPHAEAPSSVSQIMETSRFISLSAEVSSSVSQIVETTSSAPPIVETTSSAPPIVETTSSAPQIVETTSSAPPIVETTSSAPPIVETTSSAPPIVETTSSAPPIVKKSSSAPQIVEITSSAAQIVKKSSSAPQRVKKSSSAPQRVKTSSSAAQIVEKSAKKIQLVPMPSSLSQNVRTISSVYSIVESPSSVSQMVETATSVSLQAEFPSSVSHVVETPSSFSQIEEVSSSVSHVVETPSEVPQIAKTSSSLFGIVEKSSSVSEIVETSSYKISLEETSSFMSRTVETSISVYSSAKPPKSMSQLVEGSSSVSQIVETSISVPYIMETSSLISSSAGISTSVSEIVEITVPQVVEITSSVPQFAENSSYKISSVETPSSVFSFMESPDSASHISETASSVFSIETHTIISSSASQSDSSSSEITGPSSSLVSSGFYQSGMSEYSSSYVSHVFDHFAPANSTSILPWPTSASPGSNTTPPAQTFGWNMSSGSPCTFYLLRSKTESFSSSSPLQLSEFSGPILEGSSWSEEIITTLQNTGMKPSPSVVFNSAHPNKESLQSKIAEYSRKESQAGESTGDQTKTTHSVFVSGPDEPKSFPSSDSSSLVNYGSPEHENAPVLSSHSLTSDPGSVGIENAAMTPMSSTTNMEEVPNVSVVGAGALKRSALSAFVTFPLLVIFM